jgi:hypothetical protein
MTIRDRAAAVGIDPDDPRYDWHQPGGKWCDWCHNHGTQSPRLLCDVQQAEYALMDAETTSKCFRCHEPFAGKDTLCGECRARDAVAAKKERRRKHVRSTAIRMDDGRGCVESVSFAERDMYPDWFRNG